LTETNAARLAQVFDTAAFQTANHLRTGSENHYNLEVKLGTVIRDVKKHKHSINIELLGIPKIKTQGRAR
jgi:hypothetical protein